MKVKKYKNRSTQSKITAYPVVGDANGRGFQYPIPTYSITKNFDWSETENNKLLFEMTAKYGIKKL